MYLLIFFGLVLMISIITLIILKMCDVKTLPKILFIGESERIRYFQAKLSSLYNITTVSNYDKIYEIDIKTFDCVVNIDCTSIRHLSYIIRKRTPILNLSKIDFEKLKFAANKSFLSYVSCDYLTEGYIHLKKSIDNLKLLYSYQEGINNRTKTYIFNNGLEKIKIEFEVLNDDAYLNCIIDYINLLLKKNVKYVY